MGQWIFKEKSAGNATGDAFRNSFEGEDIVVTLARESIQNSVDAGLPRQTPRMVFTKRSSLDLSNVLTADFLEHAEASKVPWDLDCSSASALYVEDFGTTGLTGSMRDPSSNFFRLMGQLGGGHTEGSTGGSFGYGKAAAILNSQCWTVLAYTVTDEGSRLFGTTYLDQHTCESGGSFTGLGWFCAEDSDSTHPIEIEGSDADDLATLLGFPRSRTREQGTSLMILCPSTDLRALCQAVEMYWWPRLLDHNLEVSFIDDDLTFYPNVRSNKALRDLIGLYEIAQRRSKPMEGERDVRLTLSQKPLGTLVMKFCPETEEIADDAQDVSGCIALMRLQRMVVSYYRWNQGPRRDFSAVFVADDSINDDLRKTENLRHDAWSPKATRATQEQRQLAKTVLEVIRRQYRQFLNSYSPPPSQDDVSLLELRRFFGNLLSSRGTSGGGNKADPIEITNKHVSLEESGGSLFVKGRAKYRWKGKQAASISVGAIVELAESDLSTSGDKIPVTLSVDGSVSVGEKPQVIVPVSPGQVLNVEFQSEKYEPDWTATATFQGEVVQTDAK